jgi:hypothetical protein
MKPIKERNMDVLEDLAMMGADEIRAFFAYQGDNAKYFKKARIGMGVLAAFSRVRASETNRMAVELASRKVLTGQEPRTLTEEAESVRQAEQ